MITLSEATNTVRALRPEEQVAAARSVREWIGADASLTETYPQAFHPDGDADSIALLEGDEIVSHAALRWVRVWTPETMVNVALVGSVATAPERRGRGHASSVLRYIETTARGRGRDAVMLWSGDWDFYARLGYRPVGRQHEIAIRAPERVDTAGVRLAQAGDLPSILKLHRAKPTAVERDLHDLAVLLAARPMTTVVLERGGELVSYACFGKGMDFPGWWHDFGGDDDDVATLVTAATRALAADTATVIVPPYRRDLLARLCEIATGVTEGVVALAIQLTPQGGTELFVDGLDSI